MAEIDALFADRDWDGYVAREVVESVVTTLLENPDVVLRALSSVLLRPLLIVPEGWQGERADLIAELEKD